VGVKLHPGFESLPLRHYAGVSASPFSTEAAIFFEYVRNLLIRAGGFMKKTILVAVCSLSLLFTVGACKNKQEQTAPPTGMERQLPAGHVPTGPVSGQPNVVMPKGEPSVTVPDSVKGKWKAVVIAVEDKATKKSKDYTVDLNSGLDIPGSNLKVEVGDFLPDFKMEGLKITSMTNEPVNPAVRIKVYENGKEIFKGWLFQKFPKIHSFEHEKYSLSLKSGVKKG
jgi:hypothetical protein